MTTELPVVHATQLIEWKTCARRAKYKQVLRLRPRGPQLGLSVGTCGHLALQAYYSKETDKPHEVFEAAWKSSLDSMSDADNSLIPDRIWDEADIVHSLLELYPDFASEHDDFEVLYTEQKFRAPVYEPGTDNQIGWHDGTWDAFVIDKTGSVWLLDHKFLARWPNEEVLKRDEQMGWYLLAARRLLPDLRVRGVLYNVLRKTNPNTARSEVFRRWKIARSDSELRSLEWNLYWSLRRRMDDDQFLPNPGPLQCPSCAFSKLCESENIGVDPKVLGPQLFDIEEATA